MKCRRDDSPPDRIGSGHGESFDDDGLCRKCLIFDLASVCNQARGCQAQAVVYATTGPPNGDGPESLAAGRFMAYAAHRWSDAAFILLRLLNTGV